VRRPRLAGRRDDVQLEPKSVVTAAIPPDRSMQYAVEEQVSPVAGAIDEAT
jgi:hypothetical protein